MTLPPAEPGLALVKPSVRAQPAYTLAAPAAARKLNQNESPYDLPRALKDEVLARARAAGWHRYPEFAPTALLERFGAHYGWRADGVLVGNGSNELIQATLTALLAPGDAVVAPVPTFSVYGLMTAVHDGRFLGVPLGPDFAWDVEALARAARDSRAKAVVLCSPNNPTGRALPDGALDHLLASTGAMLICDEAYVEFGGRTAVPRLAESSRLLVLRTFSKAMGMAGLRLGVGLGHPDVVREVAKAKLPYSVNAVTLLAAEVVLAHPEAQAARVREVLAERDRLLAGLRSVAGLTVFPTDANFVLARCEARPPREVFDRLLADHGILVRDVSSGPALHGCLRLSVGTADDTDALLAGLRAILGGA